MTLDKRPKDLKGYYFGTDPQKCDLTSGHRGTYGISGLRLWITFDETSDGKEPHLILKDLSTNGRAVGYSDQAVQEVRRGGKWEVVVSTCRIYFEIELASHETCKAEFDKNEEDSLDRNFEALPLVDELELDSYTTTARPSQDSNPKHHPIYISERDLDHGSFGGFDRVIKVRSGLQSAHKIFNKPQWEKDEEYRRV
ncbi:MAG: hypothetical protein Q9220_005878 [cf. Caloplaca sp. 1 TL-2023]